MGPHTVGRRGKRRKSAPWRGFRRGGFTPPRGSKSKGLPRAPGPVGKGMTNPFAVERFKELFIPVGWTVK